MNEKYFNEFFKRILNSFPKELSQDVNAVINILPYKNYKSDYLFDENKINIFLNGENVNIPYRIYFNEPINIIGLNDNQKIILNCLFSRHNNGFVRQKHIEKLMENKNYWITPFFIQLFGEYIYRMVEIFNEYINKNMNNCIKFISENNDYWKKIENKVASYWNEYYKKEYPEYNKYLGKEIINKIKNGIKNNGVRPNFA
jgi:hypothetical protein